MSRLRIYDETPPATPASVHTAPAEIARELGRAGVRFEQW